MSENTQAHISGILRNADAMDRQAETLRRQGNHQAAQEYATGADRLRATADSLAVQYNQRSR